MATDELRDLLERYPDLEAGELARLRQLYREASATEVMAILSSPALGPKARRIDRPHDFAWDAILASVAAIAAIAITLYLLLGR